jgi:hypothetical protein
MMSAACYSSESAPWFSNPQKMREIVSPPEATCGLIAEDAAVLRPACRFEEQRVQEHENTLGSSEFTASARSLALGFSTKST